MASARDIDTILESVVSLPSLPGIITRALAMLDDENASLHDVGELLSTDPGTAVRVLRMANSATYGLRHQVTSVEHAVPMLGAGAVRTVCISATVLAHLKRGAHAFVRQSVSCGVLMEILTRTSPTVESRPDEAFIFGVLHKVGMLIFLEHMPQECEESRIVARDRGIPLYMAEREVIGADYAEIGARLARHWELPDEIEGAIAGQHEVARCEDARYQPMAALLQVANVICMASGLISEPEDTTVIEPAAWAKTGLTNALLVQAIEEFFEALPDVDALVADLIV
jgi:HD-like signal output (HDOD) protein